MHRHVWQQHRGRSTGLGWLLVTLLPCAGIWYGLARAVAGLVGAYPP